MLDSRQCNRARCQSCPAPQRFDIRFCELIIESVWLVLLDPNKDECLCCDEIILPLLVADVLLAS